MDINTGVSDCEPQAAVQQNTSQAKPSKSPLITLYDVSSYSGGKGSTRYSFTLLK